MDSYRDLLVWQRAMDLSVETYGLTQNWPKSEQYGLTNQIRRAATSIAANIAEGYGRDSKGSYQQFLRIAQGSLKEFETHLLLAVRLGFSSKDEADRRLLECDQLGKMLRALIRKIEAS
ncbi:four helix bundle protein [Mesorhizobium australicum]|uniref:four helix bundle protein n=1 Tax=Mesorhizobium australicum TaxID=536018 RepID=UPI00245348C1|nr:four helix bundle protein [Mesorhizobium australicum]